MVDDHVLGGGAPARGEAERGLESFGLPAEEAALAAEIARLEPDLDPGARIALFRLLLLTRVLLARGSTRLPVAAGGDHGGVLGALLADLLGGGVEEGATEGAAESAIATAAAAIRELLDARSAPAVVGAPGDYRPLVFDGRFVATQQVSAFEARLAEGLAAALARDIDAPGRAALDAALSAAEAEAGPPLADAQRAAVRAALEHALVVITGGPGTGKTSIVAAILHGVTALGAPPEAIALAAPTGKAAHRMAAAVDGALDAAGIAADHAMRGIRPRTLHQLLGYLPGAERFRRHAHHPLEEAVVVVDEASMIDVFLMARLIAAAGPGTRLVLIGDADQLPSVEAGAVFRDLVAAGDPGGPAAGRVIRLTESFRVATDGAAGRAILETAALVNAGDVEGLAGSAALVRRDTVGALAFDGVEAVFDDGPAARESFFRRWLDDVLVVDEAWIAAARGAVVVEGAGLPRDDDRARVLALLAHHERGRILGLTHHYATGVEAANRRLHDAYARRAARESARDFLPGEPVMMQVNDHARGLMNGDTGVAVLGRDPDGDVAMYVVFPRGAEPVAHPLAPLRARLSLAWALTVHKSQGSEFDTVGLLLPPKDLPLLSRELLYTAITRARRSVILLGDEARLVDGVRRAVDRFSGVRERLDELRPGETPF